MAPDARLEAVITTAALDEADKSAWCRQHGVYPGELDKSRANCTAALAESEEARASPQATRQDRKRIKKLERDLLRKAGHWPRHIGLELDVASELNRRAPAAPASRYGFAPTE